MLKSRSNNAEDPRPPFSTSMKITNTRTEHIHFSRMIEIKGNRSESLCEMPYAVHTVETDGFQADGFVSAEYRHKLTRDVVRVDGRYFTVGRSTGNMVDYWLTVTLPPGMDPRPQPREWEVRVNTHQLTGVEYIWDTQVITSEPGDKVIKVREVLD